MTQETDNGPRTGDVGGRAGTATNGTESTRGASRARELDKHSRFGNRLDAPQLHSVKLPATSPFSPVAQAAAQQQADLTRRWRTVQFALGSLDPSRSVWESKVHTALERANLTRGWNIPPRLMFDGGTALESGATEDELRAHGWLTPEGVRALCLREAAELEADKATIKAQARLIVAQRELGTVAPPEPVSLTDLLAQPDEDAAYRVAELWPTGGRVLLAAQYKAGKSTTAGNLVRSLVDGAPFLGKFATATVRKVVLLDTELDTRTLRRWLREQGIANTNAVTVWPLRGKVSTFDILDRAGRSEWARRIAGADVVILDCLRPVLDALGLSEDKDAGKFLVAFDDMLAEAGADEAMVITHMGHQNERARGDSRLLDWNDAMWKLVRDPNAAEGDHNAQRYFSALGRDVDLPEGALEFDSRTRHLTFQGGSRRDAAGNALVPDLLALLRKESGLSGRQIEAKLTDQGAARNDIRAALTVARREGLVRTEDGPRNATLHYAVEVNLSV